MKKLIMVLLLMGIWGCGKVTELPDWFTKDWFVEYKSKVIELEHPFEDIGKVFPFINTWDEITSMSSGIRWIRVKDKRTGDEYEMAKGTYYNQWLFKKFFCGLHNDKILKKEEQWHFTGDLPDWLEILPWEIKWRERELKELKERKYICD